MKSGTSQKRPRKLVPEENQGCWTRCPWSRQEAAIGVVYSDPLIKTDTTVSYPEEQELASLVPLTRPGWLPSRLADWSTTGPLSLSVDLYR